MILEQPGRRFVALGLDDHEAADIVADVGDPLLRGALELSRRSLRDELARGDALSNPAQVANFLKLWLRDRSFEVFAALFLDARNRLIVAEELFRGTLTQTAVYPREIVRRALEVNAAGVILAHNHPSGVAEPSTADRLLTQALRAACALVDVQVLDHVIVAGHQTHSFAAHGGV
jgi:DNA repair protein RadC